LSLFYCRHNFLLRSMSFMTSLRILSGKESEDIPYLYWIPKLHKTPYKERYIGESSTCSTKGLSIDLNKKHGGRTDTQQHLGL
jgi:hypothetical protein